MQALEETLDILSDPHAREELAEAREALAVGDFVDGIEAVWRLRPRS